MGDVISFDPGSQDQTVTQCSGEAICQGCGYEFLFFGRVSSNSASSLLCPNCMTTHAVFKSPVVSEGAYYRCGCGCEAFGIVPEGVLCRFCGKLHPNPWELM
mgnify:CR=1 FL=1